MEKSHKHNQQLKSTMGICQKKHNQHGKSPMGKSQKKLQQNNQHEKSAMRKCKKKIQQHNQQQKYVMGKSQKKLQQHNQQHKSTMRKSQKMRLHNQQQGLSRFEQLPDDVLLIILSFLPTIYEIARTCILCRRWRNLWHNVTCLDFDASAMLPVDQVEGRCAWYILWVNQVLETRAALPGSPSVKDLRIRYAMSARHSCHIDRWIGFAIVNRVETLHLEFSPYFGLLPPNTEYNLTEESWFKAPSGSSSLQCLKSLFLRNVNVTKQFIEFVLLNCPLLEDLTLQAVGPYSGLNVTREPPLRLRRLNMEPDNDFALNTLCAPHLTSFYHSGFHFNPQKIDVPSLKDLTIGGFCPSIMHYLKHFWNYIPQLESLHLLMDMVMELRLDPIQGLAKLKNLTISVSSDTNRFFDQLLRFVKACPLIETFEFQMYLTKVTPVSGQQEWDRKEELSGCFKRLKEVKLCGNYGKTLDQGIAKFIINNAPYLEKLHVDVPEAHRYNHFWVSELDVVQATEVKAKELCQGRPFEVEVKVFG